MVSRQSAGKISRDAQCHSGFCGIQPAVAWRKVRRRADGTVPGLVVQAGLQYSMPGCEYLGASGSKTYSLLTSWDLRSKRQARAPRRLQALQARLNHQTWYGSIGAAAACAKLLRLDVAENSEWHWASREIPLADCRLTTAAWPGRWRQGTPAATA